MSSVARIEHGGVHGHLLLAELLVQQGADVNEVFGKRKPTLSGEFRRAIHGSSLSLSIIAQRAEIPPLLLEEFLTGERNLRSDVLDRLANVLGFVLHAKDC